MAAVHMSSCPPHLEDPALVVSTYALDNADRTKAGVSVQL